MPSPFTILTGKEGASPKSSLFLIQIVSPDGDTTYLTSAAYYADTLTYAGNTYLARIVSGEFEAIQALGVLGYDTLPGFQLAIADADKGIWLNHCMPHGWRGSAVTLTVILFDVVANAYSTDSFFWSFIGGNPQHQHEQGLTTLDVTSATNFARLKMPSVPIQYRCPWDFPSTYLQRVAALTNPTSIYYQDGYSPDVPGGVGNLIAETTIGGSGLTSTATVLTVASSTGFPSVPFQATADGEEFLVTAGGGTSWTISRAQNGTTAASHSPGATFYVPFTTCDFTRSSPTDPSIGCMARMGNASNTSVAPDGDLTHDIAGHYTARFGGVTWLAPSSFSGKQYVSSTKTYGFNTPNSALPGQYYNMVYGTQWVQGQVLAPAADPNSMRSEVAVCLAAFGPASVVEVVVNGVQVPFENSSDELFTWRYITPGGRSGALNDDAIYDNQGDPHGSVCVIEFVVPAELAGPGSVPSVQVLVTCGPILNCYGIVSIVSGIVTFTGPNTACAGSPPFEVIIIGNSNTALNGAWGLSFWDSTSVTLIGTTASGTGGGAFFFATPDLFDSGGDIVSNPTGMFNNVAGPAANLAFAVMDEMQWGNIQIAQFDWASWSVAAIICATQVSYTAADGSTQSHAQFKASFQLTGASRVSLASVLTGVRNSGNLMVGPNSTTGLIQCFVRQSLCDQQPAPIPGSNFDTPVPSISADGSIVNGYYAYYFNETNIDRASFKITTTRIESTPNTVAIDFQDEQNGYSQDSLTEVDANAYDYSGDQEIQVPVSILAVPNFDQGMRVANVLLAEAEYGNNRNDAGGTLYFEFTCNQRVLHLTGRLGYICALSFEELGIGVVLAGVSINAPQAVRILSLQPDMDGDHWAVKCAYHNDEWYTYAYGQNPTPFQQNPLVGNTARPPYPWRPCQDLTGSDLYSYAALPLNIGGIPGNLSFGINLNLSTYPATITVSGHVPVNSQPATKPPTVPLQCATGNTGGLLPPGTYLVAVSSNGLIGPVSQLFSSVTIPAGTSTNQVVLANIVWPNAAAPDVGVFVGPDSQHMGYIGDAGLGNWVGSDDDANGNPTTITITAGFAQGLQGLPDQVFQEFAVIQQGIAHGGVWGDVVTAASSPVITIGASFTTNQWVGRTLSLYYTPGANLQYSTSRIVSSNTTDTITLNHTGGGFLVGAVVVMRCQADTFSPNTIGDSGFINSYYPSGIATDGREIGFQILIIAGTGAGTTPKTIISNTSTVYTIAGTFDVTPDATSVFIVLYPAQLITDGSTVQSGGTTVQPLTGINVAAVPCVTTAPQSMFIVVATADASGNYGPQKWQPWREVYVPEQLSTSNPGYYTVIPASGVATIDLVNGYTQRLVLDYPNAAGSVAITIAAPVFTGGVIAAGIPSLILLLDQDPNGGEAMPTFTGGAGGFASNTAAEISVSGMPNTRTPIVFSFIGGVWCVISWSTGGAIS